MRKPSLGSLARLAATGLAAGVIATVLNWLEPPASRAEAARPVIENAVFTLRHQDAIGVLRIDDRRWRADDGARHL